MGTRCHKSVFLLSSESEGEDEFPDVVVVAVDQRGGNVIHWLTERFAEFPEHCGGKDGTANELV